MFTQAATREFVIGIVGIDGATRYTPRPATVNSVPGRIWTRWTMTDGAWIHCGKAHVRKAAAEIEVISSFDEI